MAVENLLSDAMTLRADGRLLPRATTGADLKRVAETIEVTAAASATSTYDLFTIPSNAIIHSMRLRTDDLASTGSPTLDVGLFHPNLANGGDDDCLFVDADVASGAVDTTTYAPIAAPNQEAWDYVASQTTDPNEDLTVRATIKDAATNTGGTITLEILYS